MILSRHCLKTEVISIQTHAREELLDITSAIQSVLERCSFKDGIVVISAPHTTAAVTINEKADPDVRRDIIQKLSSEFPQQDNYRHSEGNSDAHIKSSLVGASLSLIVENGQLMLGTWQAIFFCEFDGPRRRQLYIKPIPS